MASLGHEQVRHRRPFSLPPHANTGLQTDVVGYRNQFNYEPAVQNGQHVFLVTVYPAFNSFDADFAPD